MKQGFKFISFTLALIILGVLPRIAQAQDSPPPPAFDGVYLDEFHFAGDDTEMTKEEMEAEAQHIYSRCAAGLNQTSTFYDCECIAGQFLIQREKSGPAIPQRQLLNEVYIAGDTNCVNTPAIAGMIYTECVPQSEASRELQTDHEDYCKCVANAVANGFRQKPRLTASNIASLKVRSYMSCENPQNR